MIYWPSGSSNLPLNLP